MSARRGKKKADRRKKRGVFLTPFGRRIADVALLVLVIPVASVASAFSIVAGAAAVASRLGVALESVEMLTIAVAMAVLGLALRSRGCPAWKLELDEDAALMGPFARHRVPYEDITFVAAGTRAGWLGHGDWTRYGGPLGARGFSEADPLRVESRSGRVLTVPLKHSDADKALRALQARAPNAAALDAEGHEFLPASGDRHDIIAARARLGTIWARLVWLSFALGVALVALCAWGSVHAARDGNWGALFGGLLIGIVGGWACGTAWWKALLRMRGHRRRVQQALRRPEP
jgi:hypothetical protein